MYDGLEAARWHARFEVLSNDPLVIFDGAHNPEGVCSCVESLKKYFGEEKVVVVTGVMADKDYRFIAGKIGEVAKSVMCLTPDNPRALAACEYAKVFLEQGTVARAFDTVGSAVSAAVEEAKMTGAAVACLGSLYMYAEVEAALGKQTKYTIS